MYQLTSNPNIILRDDGANIPDDANNIDWQAYQAWLAFGNKPAPAQQPTTAQLAADIRAQRDAMLASCDWTQAIDSPLGTTLKAAWAAYRTALRNLPQQASFPATVTWPTSP